MGSPEMDNHEGNVVYNTKSRNDHSLKGND